MNRIIVILVILFPFFTAPSVRAGCLFEYFDIYTIKDLYCKGECENTKIIRDDDSELYYNSCKDEKTCSVIKVGHGPSCGGYSYDIYFKDPRVVYDSGMSIRKEDLKDQQFLSTTIGNVDLEYNLVKDEKASAEKEASLANDKKDKYATNGKASGIFAAILIAGMVLAALNFVNLFLKLRKKKN